MDQAVIQLSFCSKFQVLLITSPGYDKYNLFCFCFNIMSEKNKPFPTETMKSYYQNI